MKLHRITLHIEADPDPDISYLDDADRALYHEGQLSYVGVYAIAHYTMHGTCQTIISPSLWGIEHWHMSSHVDRSEEYIRECLTDEQTALAAMLQEIGFAANTIATAPVEEHVH